jgi:site-specific DNA recombinase
MLANPIYVGEIRHKRISYPGQHEPIVERAQWQRVQEMLKQRAALKRGGASERAHGLLTGKLFDENGEPLYACWAKKGARRYRYFVSRKLIRGAHKSDDNGWRLPAEEIEQAVIAATRQMLSDRMALVTVLKSAGLAASEMKQAIAVVARKLKSVDGLGSLEVARSIIERLELRCEGIQITLNLGSLLGPELSSG